MSRRGLERLAVGWAVWVARRPWRVIAATLLLVAVAATGLPRLELSNSFRVYFSEENPERVAFEALEATYAKSDNILFVLRPAAGDVFTAETLASLERLTEAAWRLPWASRVDSPTNFQHSRAEGDELIVADLVRGAEKLDRRALARVRSTALAEPALAGLLVSPDGSTAGVNVVFQFPGASRSEVPEAVAAARELARQTEAGTPGIRVYLSGVALLDHAFADAGQRDGATLLPVMLGVVVLFLAVVLRSLSACLATLAVLGCATLSALGLAGHLGIRLTPVAMTAPTIILTLAVADGVHLFGTILSTRRRGASRRGALAEALRVNLVPVSVTSATTMVGFLALNFADTPPFRDLGNLTALGIGAAWAAALSLLPALAMKLPLPAPRGDGEGCWTRALDAWGAWVVRRPGFALAAVGALALGAGAGLTRLGLDDQWLSYFDRRVEFRRHAEMVDRHLTGLYLVEYSVPAGEPEGIHDPEYLAVLEAFTTWLRGQPEVRHVTSYADVVKRLHQNLNGDDPAYYALPDERDRAAQYLLLYELSLPFGLDLNDRIAVDRSATRITALLDGDTTTRETRALLDRAAAWFERAAPPRMHPAPSGLGVMFARISQRNIASMLQGNALALGLIAALLIAALRSVGLGLLSLVPNAVPLLITLGLWGLLVGRVGMAGAMVSVVALGIVVDDTIHFLSHYLRARRRGRRGRSEAVRHAFRSVGPALVSTTVVLTAGFLVLALSTFRINHELGLLTAVALVTALLTDLSLLPALLLLGRRADEKEVPRHEPLTARG